MRGEISLVNVAELYLPKAKGLEAALIKLQQVLMFATSSGSWNVVEKYKQCMFYIGKARRQMPTEQMNDWERGSLITAQKSAALQISTERNISCSWKKSKTTRAKVKQANK